MAFSMTIRGRKTWFSKKTRFNIDDVLNKLHFRYGSYSEEQVLKEGVREDSTFIVYNPYRIGRGITIDTAKLDVFDEITISYNIPTTQTEINDFFKLAHTIVKSFGKAEIFNDVSKIKVKDFPKLQEKLVIVSLDELNQKTSQLQEDEDFMMTTARFPYTFFDEDIENFAKCEDLMDFEEKLHMVQEPDYYYAKPNIMLENATKQNWAIYTLTEESVSLFPVDGANTARIFSHDTVIDKTFIRFYIYSEEKLIDGLFHYDKFIELMTQRKCEQIDKVHIAIPPLKKVDMIEITRRIRRV